jgi:hypothetical protein
MTPRHPAGPPMTLGNRFNAFARFTLYKPNCLFVFAALGAM